MLKPAKYALVIIALAFIYIGAAQNARADQYVTLNLDNGWLVATPGGTVHMSASATNRTNQAFTIDRREIISAGIGILIVFDDYVLNPPPLPITGGAFSTVSCNVFDFSVIPNAAPRPYYFGDIHIYGHLADGTAFTDAIPIALTVVAPDEVPEPASMLLFGSGLAGLAGIYRKRRKQR